MNYGKKEGGERRMEMAKREKRHFQKRPSKIKCKFFSKIITAHVAKP